MFHGVKALNLKVWVAYGGVVLRRKEIGHAKDTSSKR